jgi:hypothetical protein
VRTMLVKLPKHLPSLREMLIDIGNPHPEQIAKSLGVGYSTVRRWIVNNDAPRPAMLALFWLTQWGQQRLDADLFNWAQIQAGLYGATRRELDQAKGEITQLQNQITRLGRLGEFGSANDPMAGATGPGPMQPAPIDVDSIWLTFGCFERIPSIELRGVR